MGKELAIQPFQFPFRKLQAAIKYQFPLFIKDKYKRESINTTIFKQAGTTGNAVYRDIASQIVHDAITVKRCFILARNHKQ